VILGGGYIFKLKMADKTSPPSSVGLATAFTNNGTRGLALGASLNFAENKYRTTVAFGKGRAVYRYYGIGQTPGAEDRSVMLRQNGTVFFGEFLRNTWKDVFIGARYQYRKLSTTIEDIQLPGGIEIPPIDLETTSASLGFKVMRDLRDNSFYPTKGSLWTVTGDFFSEALGSRRNYRVFKASYNGYKTIGQGQVLAYRGMACSVSDETPFFDLCYFGGSDLRGYSTGQFQNRRMFATQVEYRRELPWRFGLVGFGGVGGVARRLNEFRFDELLPAVGAGLRFKLEKTNHINYRIDLGYGRAGYTLSLSVTEAF
jgi:outer membrane protein assembly factor BamA